MNPIAPQPALRNLEPPRSVTASLPERRNEGSDGVLGDGHFPILSTHWPWFPPPLRWKAA